MMRVFIQITAVLIVLIASCSSRSGGTIEDKSGIITFTTKEHIVKAKKISPVFEEICIVTKAETVTEPSSMRYLDALFVLIPQGESDNSKDPTVNKTTSDQSDIERMFILAADGPSQKQIMKLIAMNSKKLHPIIRISATEIRVTDLSYQGQKVFLSGDLGRHFLVNRITILKDN